MVQIPEEVLRLLIKNNNVALIGSVDKAGVPNISPRFVLGIIGNNDRLLFADLFENKTLANLEAWNKVTASVIDVDTMGGYQLKGEASEATDAPARGAGKLETERTRLRVLNRTGSGSWM